MIVVDTSALIAIVKNESVALICQEILARQTRILVNAATLTETLIVARGKKCLPGLTLLVNELPLVVIEVDESEPNGLQPFTPSGARAFTKPPSTSVIASPMPPPRNSIARCFTSVKTSR
jgi:hypothetical protein